jgi:hypothetical protein
MKPKQVYMDCVVPGPRGVIYASLFSAETGSLVVSGTLFYCLDQLSRESMQLVCKPAFPTIADQVMTDETWVINIQA